MVALVTQMLGLNKKLQDAKLEHEKTLLSRQVEATDAAIDARVYELYGLTEEGITIVEGRTYSHKRRKISANRYFHPTVTHYKRPNIRLRLSNHCCEGSER
jgi:hypothetical protein